MKKKWPLILLALVLTAGAVAFAFRDAIMIRISPKMVLTGALTKTVSALQTRLEDSPLTVLGNGLDPTEGNTIQMKLKTSNALLGEVTYNMDILAEWTPRRILAEGAVTSASGTLDLSLYLDGNFAAVSSDSLVGGNFYGITYETFPQDIRRNGLLAYMIGEQTIGEWETSVSALREQMNQSWEMPQYSEADLMSMAAGILTLKAQVSSEDLTLNGQELKTHKVTFSATGPEIAAAAEAYMQDLSAEVRELVGKLKNDPQSALAASFYVYQDVVAKLSLELTLENETLRLELLLGDDAAAEDLTIGVVRSSAELLDKLAIQVSTQRSEEHYAEKMDLVRTINGVQDRTVIDYTWDLTDGDMQLNLTEGTVDSAVQLNLQKVENGFRLSTEQFESLMSIFTDEKTTGNSECTMTVTKGAVLETPEYRNFDQWSMDDLLSLLGGIGALLGLRIG